MVILFFIKVVISVYGNWDEFWLVYKSVILTWVFEFFVSSRILICCLLSFLVGAMQVLVDSTLMMQDVDLYWPGAILFRGWVSSHLVHSMMGDLSFDFCFL